MKPNQLLTVPTKHTIKKLLNANTGNFFFTYETFFKRFNRSVIQ